MRSTIVAAAFAATAMAVPYAKPALVTTYDTDVVYVTNVVYVTAGADAPTAAPADTEPTAPAYNGGWHWPHKPNKPNTEPQAPPPAATNDSEAPSNTEAPAAYSPASEESSPAAPAPSGLSGYSDIVVAHHNVHRTNHSAPEVQWDEGLASTAAKIAQSCVYAHNTDMDGGGYGQNIAAGVEANNVSAVITDLFYNGEVGYYNGMYGQANPDMSQFELWGHFSQIVWKSTTKVGCATQSCPGGLGNVGSNVSPYFTVCNYSPPGNYGGEYGDNVLASKDEPTVNWNYGM